jgi:type IV secretory pathway VirB3-like protein
LRNIVGAAKISISTLLIAGICYPSLVLIPSLIMAFLMICAQIAHIRVKNPLFKFLPSFVLLILSLFVAAVHSGIIKS